DLLQRSVARGLKMICANPDLEVLMRGQREICAGALAERYEALGGEVRYHGKPYPSVYHEVFGLMGNPPKNRVGGIGDSLRPAVAGARGVGIDSILITGGIHAETLGAGPGELPDPARLDALCAQVGVRPTVAMPGLRW